MLKLIKLAHFCKLILKKDVKRQLFFSGRYGIYPKMTGAGGGGCLYAFLKPGERIEF